MKRQVSKKRKMCVEKALISKKYTVLLLLLLCCAAMLFGCARPDDWAKKTRAAMPGMLFPVGAQYSADDEGATEKALPSAPIAAAEPKASPNELQMVHQEDNKHVLCENGFLSIEEPRPSTRGQHLMFCDFDTMQQRYLCTDETCQHNTSACISFISEREFAYIYIWKGKLYLHYSGYEASTFSDLSRLQPNEPKQRYSRIEQRNLDGTGARVLYEDTEYYSLTDSAVITDGEKIYFSSRRYGYASFDPETGELNTVIADDENKPWRLEPYQDRILSTGWSENRYVVEAMWPSTGERKLLHSWESNTVQLFIQPGGKTYVYDIQTGALSVYDVTTDTEQPVTDAFAAYGAQTKTEEGELYGNTLWSIEQYGDWILGRGTIRKEERVQAYNIKTHETRELTLSDYAYGYMYPIHIWAQTPRGLLVTEESRMRVINTVEYAYGPQKRDEICGVYALLDFEDLLASRPAYRVIHPVAYEGIA